MGGGLIFTNTVRKTVMFRQVWGFTIGVQSVANLKRKQVIFALTAVQEWMVKSMLEAAFGIPIWQNAMEDMQIQRDVQPVPQWISVKDRLPESEKEVLVWYRYIWGDGSTSYGFGISWWYSNAKQWRDGCLLKGVEVLYWQPLPEPPKDGDTNG